MTFSSSSRSFSLVIALMGILFIHHGYTLVILRSLANRKLPPMSISMSTSNLPNYMSSFKQAIASAIIISSSFYPASPLLADDAVALTNAAPQAVIAPSPLTSENKVSDIQAFNENLQNARQLYSDEFEIPFEGESLGLKLIENLYKGFPVVTVREILSTDLVVNHRELEVGAIVTRVDNERVDGIYLKDIIAKIKAAKRPVTLQFRDPSRFLKLLDSTEGRPKRIITTQYLPANTRDEGAQEQVIKVERLVLPPPEERRRPAEYLDVLEIQYVATIAGDESNRIADSSAEHSAPGSSARSIYYVLGQQNGPPGRFPKGWDLTLRGMVVGETRKITLPYSLAYDRKGDKIKQIPPFANLIYVVKLKSLT